MPHPSAAARRWPPTSTCPRGEEPLTLASVSTDSPGLALGTAQGVVKRVTTDYPARSDFELIGLKDGDSVVGAAELADDRTDLVFITSDAQLLHFPASQVRPQGRPAGGMAGIKLAVRPAGGLVRRRRPGHRPGRGDVQSGRPAPSPAPRPVRSR